VRVCLAYDCLYPYTVGGAERWYRNLAERLAADGHEVTYLTRRQWDEGDPPAVAGVRVVAVSPGGDLYGPDGNRRTGPPIRFGAGVLRHLLRRGRDYDVVHMASFPYFSVLAAAAARPRGRYRLVIDWHEVWTRGYWLSYLGPLAGRIGYSVQRRCVRVRHRPFCFSRLHHDRLIEEGVGAEPTILEGEYAGDLTPPEPRPAEPLVVFAGRQIREKRAPAAVEAIARARSDGLDVRGMIFGDGPERSLVLGAIAQHGLEGLVEAPGFVTREEVDAALLRALCLLHPSEREGYGLIVIEAAAHGTPVVVADGPDNAAVELVESGVNGVIAPSADPAALAAAIRVVADDGDELRVRTCRWFAANAQRLSLESSLAAVLASYREER
jgi:glycosyltransferase involved in cell wall biosynthesis